MNAIRVMTFNVRQCRGRDGQIDPERIRRVIEQCAPDIVALQEVEASSGSDHLSYLGAGLKMLSFGRGAMGSNAFLSRYPLKGVQEFSLGSGGVCLKGDMDLLGKRVHLFNVRLDPYPFRQFRQLKNLFGAELVGNPYFPCSKLILGDFGAICPWFWGCHLTLSQGAPNRPLWRPTYPARFPLFSRARIYRLGDIEVQQSAVNWNSLTRSASSHLPLSVTVYIRDTFDYLHAERMRERMEIAPGCFRKKAAL